MRTNAAWFAAMWLLALSRDPVRYRATIPPSILEKAAYGMALIVLYSRHRVPLSVLAAGSGDWMFAFLFLAAYFTAQSGSAAV